MRRDTSLQQIVDACIEAADAFEDDDTCDIELAQPQNYEHPALKSPKLEREQLQQIVFESSDESEVGESHQPQMDIAVSASESEPEAEEEGDDDTQLETEPEQVPVLFTVGDIVQVRGMMDLCKVEHYTH